MASSSECMFCAMISSSYVWLFAAGTVVQGGFPLQIIRFHPYITVSSGTSGHAAPGPSQSLVGALADNTVLG